METDYTITVRSRFSLAICLVDAFTTGPPLAADIRVQLEGAFRQPIRKPGGTYVFSDVPDGHYRVRIDSNEYFPQMLDVQLDSSNENRLILHVPLTPRPSYPFAAGTSLIRAALRDEQNQPIAGANVTAVALLEDVVWGRLTDPVQQGDRWLRLRKAMGKPAVGESFAIRMGDTNDFDYGRIAVFGQEPGLVQLTAPLQREHPKGASCLPAVQTISDERGEVVVPFYSNGAKQFVVVLTFQHQHLVTTKDILLREGEMNYLGTVRM
ncbi:hypothetical protein LOK74_12770 [Brevibacillus humidisoli]|uniref:hypothetical protein n=1 Tax=Brevibacillus humidisoli TaxID=2895522 RepID=UPI001E31CAFE|nr:hypothetical protein [Brevibacillus humidisoli]UFJ38957.1 hypothetical protein LOK74_12770 [Brevibacillus humidisoli]